MPKNELMDRREFIERYILKPAKYVTVGGLFFILASYSQEIYNCLYDLIYWKQAKTYKERTKAAFKEGTEEYNRINENLKQSLDVLIDHPIVIGADWCKPCHNLERDLKDQYQFKIYTPDLLEHNQFDNLPERTVIKWDLTNSDVGKTVEKILQENYMTSSFRYPVLIVAGSSQHESIKSMPVFYNGYTNHPNPLSRFMVNKDGEQIRLIEIIIKYIKKS